MRDGLCSLALVECLRGRGRGDALLQAATDLGEEAAGWRVHGWPAVHRALAALWSDGHREAAVEYRRLTDCAVTRGDDGSVPALLNDLALAEYLIGRWPEAETTATAALELSLQAGERPQQAMALAVRARVEASTGRDREARTDAHAALALAGERAMAMARIHSVSALALLDLTHDRPQNAAERLRAVRERLLIGGVGEPGAIGFVVDEIEALVALARYPAAAELVDWLEARGRALGDDVILDLDHSATAAHPAPDSVGDEDVFTADFYIGDTKVGFDGGACKLVRQPAFYHCIATNSFAKGDLTVQFLADFTQTAPGHFAITGGTGAYRGATGEVTFVDHPDPQRDDVTFRFTT